MSPKRCSHHVYLHSDTFEKARFCGPWDWQGTPRSSFLIRASRWVSFKPVAANFNCAVACNRGALVGSRRWKTALQVLRYIVQHFRRDRVLQSNIYCFKLIYRVPQQFEFVYTCALFKISKRVCRTRAKPGCCYRCSRVVLHGPARISGHVTHSSGVTRGTGRQRQIVMKSVCIHIYTHVQTWD